MLYLQTPTHETVLDVFTQEIKVYTSGMTIASVLHHKNYDCLVLDMKQVESMEVLESSKHFLPDRYVISCCSDSDLIKESLLHGADAISVSYTHLRAHET